uniref:Uncharacterized protein n=1 Tax=Trypanosoma congolense (strain IL3000) TaxID=1068625 RepID=G0UU90_TRYCI|nr:conserved hypothetical protein [Trypanosoma congolense IL3000]
MGCFPSAGRTHAKSGSSGVARGADGTASSVALDGRDGTRAGFLDGSVASGQVAPTMKPTLYTDYSGTQVTMTNGTIGKANNICRWLDAALEKRKKHGGWYTDVFVESGSSSRLETSYYSEGTVQTYHHVVHFSTNNRCNADDCFAVTNSDPLLEKLVSSKSRDSSDLEAQDGVGAAVPPKVYESGTVGQGKWLPNTVIRNKGQVAIRYSPESSTLSGGEEERQGVAVGGEQVEDIELDM